MDDEAEQLRLLEETGAYGPYRKEYIKKDGTTVPVELNGFIIENYNGVKGIFSLVEDISEKIATDQKIEVQRKKLVHSAKLASIGEMAAGVGHEINNPLAIAMGNITLIKRFLKSKGIVNGNMDRYLDSISYANERIRKIVDGLKLYSRLDSSIYKKASMNEAILETFKLTSEIYEKDGIFINFDKETEDLFIKGSLGELQQILVNLLSNAKDATKGKSNREILIELVKKGDYAQLSISDNGKGIPDNVKEHIFDPFFTTKEPGKGTGLGLGLVYELIKKMDGDISIESTPGEGSTFKISLPIFTGIEEVEEAVQEKVKPLVNIKGKALVVDDEADIRFLLKEFLTNAGLEVDVADDGDSGLEKTKLKEYDLIYTDMKMPKMNGEEFINKAKLIQPEKTRFIIVTGGVTKDYTKEVGVDLHSLADANITKPFSIESIEVTLRNFLSHR